MARIKTRIEKRHKNNKLFYGWWIVVAASVGLFMSYPPIMVYSFSVS
ncbi:MAG: hypothetical protein JETT_1730 [Candidatus Jettenia ecosi]|uniref:Uncharacterized protein n=1 Tax=Candidatus Jettenia ecosi TaxID=2494326 RepID=A0A533QH88_9BACT|nr:MAG: hypothetical protein JETT_1730 [Candidatus Jettenia ecosi]